MSGKNARKPRETALTVTLRKAREDAEPAREDGLRRGDLLLLRFETLLVRQELVEQVVDNVGCADSNDISASCRNRFEPGT